jgi:hypothetical protein
MRNMYFCAKFSITRNQALIRSTLVLYCIAIITVERRKGPRMHLHTCLGKRRSDWRMCNAIVSAAAGQGKHLSEAPRGFRAGEMMRAAGEGKREGDFQALHKHAPQR